MNNAYYEWEDSFKKYVKENTRTSDVIEKGLLAFIESQDVNNNIMLALYLNFGREISTEGP